MSLSEFEIEVLTGIIEGEISKEIADRTGRSKPTIDAYVRLLCAKFGARSRPHLAALAISSGCVELRDKALTFG
jgi:DNA-binding CsgD family transcriptional regulator